MQKIFGLILLLFVVSCNNTMKEETTLPQQLISALNAHETSTVLGSIAENHNGNTANGSKISDKTEFESAWKSFFGQFPDFTFKLEKTITEDGTTVLIGETSGSLNGQKNPASSFKTPAMMRIETAEGKILSAEFYADFSLPVRIAGSTTDSEQQKPGVTGIGGVFFKSKDPKNLIDWYNRHLGMQISEHAYMMFQWRDHANPALEKSTTFSIFNETSDYYAPSEKPFMINFMVNELDALMAQLKADVIQLVGEIGHYDYGNFGWIMDPEGNKIELWEPVEGVLEAYEESTANQ